MSANGRWDLIRRVKVKAFGSVSDLLIGGVQMKFSMNGVT